MRQVISDRSSGILLHISSLPGSYGVGDIGHAINFIDFLVSAGQSYWQILPVNPTSPIFGNSPYMSFSAFAGNPLLISPDILFQDGLLKKEDLAAPEFSPYLVEFERVISWKQSVLKKAWQHFQEKSDKTDFNKFCHDKEWLLAHALFMSLKNKYNQTPWYSWPEEIKSANKKYLLVAIDELAGQIDYFRFEQYIFF